jgi:hypothetical protein
MTDEQWLWLYIQEAVDNDIKLEGMCSDCREEVTSKEHRKCTRCGKPVHIVESFVNPNFDMNRYNALANGTVQKDNTHHEDPEDIDEELDDNGD